MNDDIRYRVAWHRLGAPENGRGEWVSQPEANDELYERKILQPDLQHYWIEDDAGPRCRRPDELGRCMCDPALQ